MENLSEVNEKEMKQRTLFAILLGAFVLLACSWGSAPITIVVTATPSSEGIQNTSTGHPGQLVGVALAVTPNPVSGNSTPVATDVPAPTETPAATLPAPPVATPVQTERQHFFEVPSALVWAPPALSYGCSTATGPVVTTFEAAVNAGVERAYLAPSGHQNQGIRFDGVPPVSGNMSTFVLNPGEVVLFGMLEGDGWERSILLNNISDQFGQTSSVVLSWQEVLQMANIATGAKYMMSNIEFVGIIHQYDWCEGKPLLWGELYTQYFHPTVSYERAAVNGNINVNKNANGALMTFIDFSAAPHDLVNKP